MKRQSKVRPIERRNRIISAFVGIIKQHVRYRIDVSISVPHFNSLVTQSIADAGGIIAANRYLQQILDEYLNDPFFFLIGNFILALCDGLHKRGVRERCDLYFDTQILEMCPSSALIYDVMKNLAPPNFRQLLPPELISRDDANFTPFRLRIFWHGYRGSRENQIVKSGAG